VAFDIAGEGKADAGSMLAALDAAIAMVQQRKFFHGQ
jgi:4-hydroxy-L-threonine phosphate dehydrogenase PdxA